VLLDEIAAFLSDRGYGTVGANILFSTPATPDRVVVLTEYPGDEPVHVKRRVGPVIERPRFQVTTRDLDAAAARLLAERIYRDLTGFYGEINGVAYSRILALQPPFFLMRDESRRTSFNNNYRVWKQPSPIE
jgi:ABC-type Fe3+-hydroxamate transport system substrate-binding protein